MKKPSIKKALKNRVLIRITGVLSIAALLVGGNAVAGPPSTALAAVGSCPDQYFDNGLQAMYKLDEIRRGIPPNENPNYLYGIYITGAFHAPLYQKRICGPI
ncbi:hypothetical protein ABZ671_32300 [Micromonospora sp. NPDC006766]|uniref:hypothetical protein n=1 Tax=Micromonospora sp. NPDC006766 TaxID=3154778 RepID=UPI0033FD341A